MPPARAVLLLGLLIAAATAAVFAPMLGNGFILLDDGPYVTANPAVRDGLTARGVLWSLTALRAQNWHPLTWLSHMADVQLFGLDPRGHHFTSLTLHAAAAVLLFLFLVRATGALWAAAAVAALFALHPLRVESVAWVAERKDVLGALFWMLTLLAYHRWAARRGVSAYLGALAVFGLGLAAKPMLVTLPLVLLLLDWWPLGRRGGDGTARRLLLEKMPFLALAALSSAATYVAQSRGAVVDAFHFPLQERTANALVSYAAYLRAAVLPTGLSFFYPLPPQGWPAGAVLGAGALLVLISAAALRARRRSPWFPVGWFWYLGTLVPVIGLVQVGLQARADRYTYLPLVGVFVAGVWAAREAVARRRLPAAVAGAAAGAALLALSTLTWLQLGSWRDTRTLASRALALDERNWLAHRLLGEVLEREGKADEARRHRLRSLQTLPGWTHRGEEALRFAARRGAGEETERLADAAARHIQEGRTEEALASWREALRRDPERVDLAFRIGEALVGLGRAAEASECFRQALQVEPGNADLHYNLGVTLFLQGRTLEAEAAYRRALEIAPDSADAHQNLGVVLSRTGRLDEAIAQFREALRLDPRHEKAAANLRDALDARGR